MSLVFWDQYLDLDDVYRHISHISESEDQRNELSQVVDDLVHHRMLHTVLENLERPHHEEFMAIFITNPNDENLSDFLKQRIKSDVSQLFKVEIEKLKSEVLSFLKLTK